MAVNAAEGNNHRKERDYTADSDENRISHNAARDGAVLTALR